MWSRKELKARAKSALSRNYWKAVLVGLIAIILEAISNFISRKSDYSDWGNFRIFGGQGINSFIRSMTIGEAVMLVMGIAAAVMVIFILFNIFIANPLYVGIGKFYNRSLSEKRQINDVVYAYKNNYWNNVKIMFLKSLYIFMWGLLCIIPMMFKALTSFSFLSTIMLIGCLIVIISKSYEYMMIPYILGDNPNISGSEAFKLSKRMMDGEKWNTFVLQLSFVGWLILSIITLGIVYVFYAEPYYNYSVAALYRKLSGADVVDEVQGSCG